MVSVPDGFAHLMETRADPLFDRDDWWSEDGFFWGLHTLLDPVRIPYFRAALAPLGPVPRVLDVGCGGGFVSEGLAATGAEVVGLDVAPSPVRAAARRPHAPRYVVGDAHHLPFGPGTFDAVVVSEVLEHVPMPQLVIAGAARVVRPGGRLLFSGPNRTPLSRLLLIDLAQRRRLTRVLPSGLHDWSAFVGPTRLRQMADSVGLHQIDVTGVTVPLRAMLGAFGAYLALRTGRVGYGAAGGRIRLVAGRSVSVAYLATLVRR